MMKWFLAGEKKSEQMDGRFNLSDDVSDDVSDGGSGPIAVLVRYQTFLTLKFNMGVNTQNVIT